MFHNFCALSIISITLIQCYGFHLQVQSPESEWSRLLDNTLREFNRASASLAWAGMTTEGNETLLEQSANLGAAKTTWRNALCDAGATQHRFKSSREARVHWLLCRGPRYTPRQARELSKLMDNMSMAYSSAEVCVPPGSWPVAGFQQDVVDGKVCLRGEPDLEKLMAKQDFTADQLHWLWKSWHDSAGPAVGVYYPRVVRLLNEAATQNGYDDIGEVWREELDIPDLEHKVMTLYEEIQPLYIMLHAVVRYKLVEKYGSQIVDPNGSIPSHLLGNMWAQDWSALIDLLIPKDQKLNLDKHIEQKNWSVKDMVIIAEDMYKSLGLPKMTEKFWKYSKFESDNNSTLCHGTAANMFDTDDYRMLVCATRNMEDFYVIHHEMGHIEYYMAYHNLPAIFQDGANSAFQESIGDSVMTGVITPQHLHRLGLITDTQLFDKNFDEVLLLQQALAKIPQIPYALLIDQYRWDIFRGKITQDFYNFAYWEMSKRLRGIIPPEPRGEEYFDAGAKFHVPDNTPYIRYFLSAILQVEMFKGMCEWTIYGKINNNEEINIPFPLHRCDIYGSRKAGTALKNMMELGASQHWSKCLKILTGKDFITAKPLLEYYKPVQKWLENFIFTHNITVGW